MGCSLLNMNINDNIVTEIDTKEEKTEHNDFDDNKL